MSTGSSTASAICSIGEAVARLDLTIGQLPKEGGAAVAGKAWRDLPPAGKATIIAVTALDAGLRAWALRDLAGRNAAEVNGPRWLWSGALGMVTSAGVLPAAYLLRGRKPAQLS